jgi:hypothetical protein
MLSDNQLTGLIPDSLGSLTSLQYLCAPARALVVWHADGKRKAGCGNEASCRRP